MQQKFQKRVDKWLLRNYNGGVLKDTSKAEEDAKMFETVKVVNGYEITRMIGSRGFYHVSIWEDGEGWSEYHTFRTIKAAVTFCETLPVK